MAKRLVAEPGHQGAVVEGLRARARRAVKAEVAEVATDLFLEHGFDQTTVEQICAASGISRSSFFRYFPTKEDILLGNLADSAEQLLVALQARPDDERPWLSLRRAMDAYIAISVQNPDVTLRMIRMVTGSPSLRARQWEKTLLWRERLTPEMARRLGLDLANLTDPRPKALVSSALSCLDAASAAWAATEGTASLGHLLDRAMDAVAE